jgi:iron complex outermembrane receptor protein
LNKFIPTAALAFGLAGAVAAPASAQDQQGVTGLEEIVVTAQKRETRLQDTPLAISAISGEALQKAQISTIQDLAASLPGLDFARGPNASILAVRGVGSIDLNVGTESRVATHTDGVYVSRPEQGLNQLFDIERIEYLRGPQGTLYGRNATAGAINIITKDPSSDYEGYLKGAFGSYSTANLGAAVNVPLSSQWSARMAVDYNRHDGYAKDITSGRGLNDLESLAVRGKLKYDADPVTLVLAGTYGKRDDHGGAFSYIEPGSPGVTPIGLVLGGRVAKFTDVATDEYGFPSTNNEYYTFSATGEWRVGENDITAIVGYGHADYYFSGETDMTSAPLTRLASLSNSDQYSTELRFHRGNEVYDFIAGGYYFHEKVHAFIYAPFNLQLLGAPPPSVFVHGVVSGGDQNATAYAAFTQLRYNITPALYLEGGARYSYERKRAVDGIDFNLAQVYNLGDPLAKRLSTPAVEVRESWDSFDPRVTLGYKPSDNVLAYATFSRGFKSGGFNLGSGGKTFDPERITSYEAGLKLSNPEQRLIANLAAFYYKYDNMQVNRVAADGVTVELINASAATIKGLEAEVRWIPEDGWNLGASADFLDSEYDNFQTADPARAGLGLQQLAGNRLPQAPKYRFRFDATYTWQVQGGDLSLRGEGALSSKVYFSPYNTPELSTPSSAEFNAFLTYDTDKYTIQAYGRNLTNYRRLVFAGTSSGLFSGFAVQGLVNDPRTYGISVTRRW